MNSVSNSNPQHWLDTYMEIADAKSPMTPMSFHEAIGLWCISTVIARRLVVVMPHDDVYPNLWVMLVAPSTLYAKTTAMNNGRNTVTCATPHLVFPDSSTPEAMLEELSGKRLEGIAKNQAGQRGLILDEASGLLAMSGRDYMSGNLELLMRFYDCPLGYKRVTRSQGEVQINGLYLTLLGASTPSMLAPYIKQKRLWANGWWARFGIVSFPEGIPQYRQSMKVDHAEEEEQSNALIRLHNRLPITEYPNISKALSVALAPDALHAFNDFDKRMRYDLLLDNPSEELGASLGRSPTQALKIATCLAAMDWTEDQDAPVIEIHHWQRAQAIAEKWLAGAKRIIELARQQDGDDCIRRVLEAIVQIGGWVSVREIYRKLSLDASKVQSALAELIAVGEIEQSNAMRGNQPVVLYKLVSPTEQVLIGEGEKIYG